MPWFWFLFPITKTAHLPTEHPPPSSQVPLTPPLWPTCLNRSSGGASLLLPLLLPALLLLPLAAALLLPAAAAAVAPAALSRLHTATRLSSPPDANTPCSNHTGAQQHKQQQQQQQVHDGWKSTVCHEHPLPSTHRCTVQHTVKPWLQGRGDWVLGCWDNISPSSRAHLPFLAPSQPPSLPLSTVPLTLPPHWVYTLRPLNPKPSLASLSPRPSLSPSPVLMRATPRA